MIHIESKLECIIAALIKPSKGSSYLRNRSALVLSCSELLSNNLLFGGQL